LLEKSIKDAAGAVKKGLEMGKAAAVRGADKVNHA
jgi:hypothetical protein